MLATICATKCTSAKHQRRRSVIVSAVEEYQIEDRCLNDAESVAKRLHIPGRNVSYRE